MKFEVHPSSNDLAFMDIDLCWFIDTTFKATSGHISFLVLS